MFLKKNWTYIFIIATSIISIWLVILLLFLQKINIAQELILFVFVTLLALACKSDFKSMTINFKLSYMLLLVALFYQIASVNIHTVIKAIISATLTLMLLIICSYIIKKIKGTDCLGKADLRTMPAIAIILNINISFIALFIACTVSIISIIIYQVIYKKKIETFPFCPVIFIWFLVGLFILSIT